MLKPVVLRQAALLTLLVPWGARARAQTPGAVQAAQAGSTHGFTQTPALAGGADAFTPVTTAMAKHRFDQETQRGLIALQTGGVLNDEGLRSLVQNETFCHLKPLVRIAYLEALRSSVPGRARDGLLALVQQPRMDFAPSRVPRFAIRPAPPSLVKDSASGLTQDTSDRRIFDPAAAIGAAAGELALLPDHESALTRLPEAQQLEAIRHVRSGVMPAISVLMGLECWKWLGPDSQQSLVDRLATLSTNPAGTRAMDTLLKGWALRQDAASTTRQVTALRTLIDGRPLRELVLPPLTLDLKRLPRADYTLGPAELTTRGIQTILFIDHRRIPIVRSLRATDSKLHTPSTIDLAEAFAHVPAWLRLPTTEIRIESVPEPHNAEKALAFDLPGFEAAATVDLSLNGDQLGPTHFWATSIPLSREALVIDLTHESLHPMFARWLLTHLAEWHAAQAEDGLSEQVYSVVDDAEDGATTGARKALEQAEGLETQDLKARYAQMGQMEAEELAKRAPPPNP